MDETITIFAGFDGTGNHKDNDTSLNDGTKTNITQLFNLYDKVEGNYTLYEEGVGTRDLTQSEIEQIQNSNGEITKKDFYNTEDMIIGDGAKDKVISMLNEIKVVIDNNPDNTINIDIAGFSRGSTSARDFVNELNKKYADDILWFPLS